MIKPSDSSAGRQWCFWKPVKITLILDEFNETLKDEASQNILKEIRSVRQQYLTSQRRMVQFSQNGDEASAINEMVNTTAGIQALTATM